MNSVGFVGDKFFPILLKIIHLHGFLLVLAINCCLGLIFVALMKETKGTSLDALISTDSKISEKTIDQNRF